jgi:hypothetical protein
MNAKNDIQESRIKREHHFIALGIIVGTWILIYLPFLASLPAGVDFSAHLFRLSFFKENGLNSEWNNLWYTGTPFLEVYPPNTTFFLWLLSLFAPLNQSYVLFMVGTHLLIAIGVYLVGNSLNRSIESSTFAALFLMTLSNLNTNFMFFSRAPTHIGLAILLLTTGLYFYEKRFTAIATACLLSMTHFMMFGFLIVIVLSSEISRIRGQIVAIKKIHTRLNKEQIIPIIKESVTRLAIWILPFIWVFILMFEFFIEPIGLIMLPRHNFGEFTDGPTPIYWLFRILRDFLYNYISIFVFMFILIFALTLKSSRLNWKEIGLLLATILITGVGFLLFYEESNATLPLMFRGMDVLRFVLISQCLILLTTIRGIKNPGSIVFLGIILLLPVAETQNGITNYGYLQFDDNHWNDLNPVADDLNQREGFFYVCPHYYQGDHMAYLPALTGKPYFDGWNPPGCQLNWFQETPPSSNKYRPNSTIIQDVITYPELYGVKWMITNRGSILPSWWTLISQNPNQTKLLWETDRLITLVEVLPSGNGTLEYLSPKKIEISFMSNETSVNLLIRVAHHPQWHVQGKSDLKIEREEEIGFMKLSNITDNNLILTFQSNHVDKVFLAFTINIIAIAILSLYENGLLKSQVENSRKKAKVLSHLIREYFKEN